ncbi:serine protease inhibitor 88Ea isoform X2 [Scaptodrosophila lebanonensis]|nr:serine protease inhibitor 88Ea isoform X2 [Scaptodrosophila lebanonensis]
MKLLATSIVVALLLPAALCADLCSESSANFLMHRGDLYRGQQEFTVSMLEAIRKAKPDENIFFSPYSTYHALLLAYFGAGSETEKELVKTLRLEWASSKEAVRSVYNWEKQMRAVRSENMPLEFGSADRIYFDQHFSLASCVEKRFYNEIVKLNFRQEPEECRTHINAWIANVTRNEIPDMLGPNDIDAKTQVVLANAAYFKGQWVSRFKEKNTEMKTFYTSGTKQSFTPMMKQKGTFLLTTDERLGAHVLQLPYRTTKEEEKDENDDIKSDISMVIILPTFNADALEQVLNKLNAKTLAQSLAEGMPREIEVSLPKFEFEQRFELVPILREMGIRKIFEGDADFNDFTAEEQISFGDAKHVAKIKVDEEGSTAAAATVLVSFRSARPIEPTKFECDHPFVFLIYDKTSQSILFTGIFRDPMTAKI